MRRRTFVLLLGLFFSNVLPALDCEKAMKALALSAYHVGRDGESLDEIPIRLQGQKFKILGAGLQGVVYRVFLENGDTYLLKNYHDLTYFDSDVGVYRSLSDFPQGGERFRVQKLVTASRGVGELELEDVQGWSVTAFISQIRKEDPNLAENLVGLFNSRAKKMKKDLEERGWTVEERTQTGEFYTFSATKSGMELVPGATNVILHPKTLEMTLIDPG